MLPQNKHKVTGKAEVVGASSWKEGRLGVLHGQHWTAVLLERTAGLRRPGGLCLNTRSPAFQGGCTWVHL